MSKKIESLFSQLSKRIVNFRMFLVWIISFFGWLLIGSLFIVTIHSDLLAVVWLYSLFLDDDLSLHSIFHDFHSILQIP
jgi:hypothetical protein